MTTALVPFDHLLRLSDDVGLLEHARFTEPRIEHGYCVDDVARGLVALARQPNRALELSALADTYFRFVCDAQGPDGRFRNRRAPHGQWQDEPSVQDCWGRALWGLGSVVGLPQFGDLALERFDRGAQHRSAWPRAMAFAALGAAEVIRVHPGHVRARTLLADAAVVIGVPISDPSWTWPEARLRYANAALAEALLSAGSLLGDARVLDHGLTMLAWLVNVETRGDHLSVTGSTGWALTEPRPAFDQQPIEIAALADACALAYEITGQSRWRVVVERCAAWFEGANDAGVEMVDRVSGGGCDGLEMHGRNENQGAESTLAMISTFQQALRIGAGWYDR